MPDTVCPICNSAAPWEGRSEPSYAQVRLPVPSDTKYWITCTRCGRYGIDIFLAKTPRRLEQLSSFVSAATRQASDRGKPLELKETTNFEQLAEPHRHTRTSQKVDKVLRFIAWKCKRPGSPITINPISDYPVADCEDGAELIAYLAYLSGQGLLTSPGSYLYEPSIAGWQLLEPTLHPGGEPGRCFVAMWFDDSLDDVFNQGFVPAVENSGFKPYRVKEDPTNKGISDRILAEIRRSQFVVADFTGQRHSVYYEAGFAQGIGREVIWCCREEDVSKLAFDTRHLGHVAWKEVADLRTKLAASIQANIIPKR